MFVASRPRADDGINDRGGVRGMRGIILLLLSIFIVSTNWSACAAAPEKGAPVAVNSPSTTLGTTAQAAAQTYPENHEEIPTGLITVLCTALVLFLLFLVSVARRDKPKLAQQDALQQRICLQCHQMGKPEYPGSGWIELILYLFYFVPGLLYSIWRRSKGVICPSCKTPTMILLHSPAGQAIVAREPPGAG
jgi:hypothetical protein